MTLLLFLSLASFGDMMIDLWTRSFEASVDGGEENGREEVGRVDKIGYRVVVESKGRENLVQTLKLQRTGRISILSINHGLMMDSRK